MAEQTVAIKATAGFVMTGRDPAKVGDVLTVDRHLAIELIHANKAELYTPPPVAKKREPEPKAEAAAPKPSTDSKE